MNQICPKRVFPLENKKSEQHHWILHIWISLGIKFHLKLTVLIEQHHQILHIWISLGIKSGYQADCFDFLDQIVPNRLFLVENKKSEHHYSILQIWMSLSIEFHLELTILIFWSKFVQKAYFRSKTEKLNISVELSIFKLG